MINFEVDVDEIPRYRFSKETENEELWLSQSKFGSLIIKEDRLSDIKDLLVKELSQVRRRFNEVYMIKVDKENQRSCQPNFLKDFFGYDSWIKEGTFTILKE